MYEQIEPIPHDIEPMSNSELEALSSIWLERKEELEAGGDYQEFLRKLQREWAIETGIIERLYNWDRGVTEALIQQGIESTLIAHRGGLGREEANRVHGLIKDQLQIVEGLFGFVKGEQPLTEHFIRGMQTQFTSHQTHTEAVTPSGGLVRVELLRGEYKSLPNNPRRRDGTVHEYCPPELVRDEMARLVEWYRQSENTIPPEVLSAWLHHRFTQIHPFQDGNGRVARALATLVFLKRGLFPLVIRDSDRTQYIEALEDADSGNLHGLVNLFSRRARDAIMSALGLEQQVQQAKYAEEIISAAVQVLQARLQKHETHVDAVYEIADGLREQAGARMSEISAALAKQLAPLTPMGETQYHANTRHAANDSPERHHFYHQIVQTAKQFNYFANLNPYRSWARIAITTDNVFEIVVSFHGIGHGARGVLVGSALTFHRVPREEGVTDAADVRPAMTDLFQFNYAEKRSKTEERFREWLEGVMAVGLGEWKRGIDA
ncbi:MAG: Fic family protein [Gammaproteobacteria bacterium]|nr:Fic family protein [Gammaproteobacteria bacterium]